MDHGQLRLTMVDFGLLWLSSFMFDLLWLTLVSILFTMIDLG
jgi:hypothetical protein